MMRTRWSRGATAALACAAAAMSPLAAENAPAPAAGGPNVVITLTIRKSGVPNPPPPRVYRMMGQEGAPARMMMGWRTPIPTLSSGSEEAGKPATTAYTYQNIGVSAEFRVRVVGGGRVRLQGEVEISGAREGPVAGGSGQKAPVIGTFQQALEVVAQEGKTLRVAEGPDPEGGTLSLDIEVDVQD